MMQTRHQQVEVNAFHYTRCMSKKTWRRAAWLKVDEKIGQNTGGGGGWCGVCNVNLNCSL